MLDVSQPVRLQPGDWHPESQIAFMNGTVFQFQMNGFLSGVFESHFFNRNIANLLVFYRQFSV